MSFKEYLKLNFFISQFATKLWFLSGEELQIEAEISKLIPKLAETREALRSDTDESKGIMDFMKVCFLREVWVSEIGTSLPEGTTEEVILKLVEGAEKPAEISDRTWTKVSNLKTALDSYSDFRMSEVGLTVALICDLHSIVGKGVILSAGQFRTTLVGAARTSVLYAEPSRISGHLQSLVTFTNDVILRLNDETQENRLKTVIRLAALFFSEFLKIHPFANGNGRVARILVNFILSLVFIVPISIFLDLDKSREVYLKLLCEAQWNENPSGLVTAFLLSAKRTVMKVEYLLLD